MKVVSSSTTRKLGFVGTLLLLLTALSITNGDPISANNAVLAPFNGWLALDGIDDYAEAQDDPELDVGIDPGSSLTIEAWAYYDRFTDAGIISHPNSCKVTMWVDRYSNPYLYCFNFWWYPPGYQQPLGVGSCDNPAYPSEIWHHIAAVADGATQQVVLYVDGEKVAGTQDYGGVLNDSQDPLRVGTIVNYIGEWKYYPGRIDEVRISDIVRYSGDSFVVPTLPYECDEHTRALWHFDEAEGATTFHDSCGTGDNFLVGYNGTHTEGMPVHRIYLPLVSRQ